MKKQRVLFYLFWFILSLPNFILAFTEQMNVWGKCALIILPVAVFGVLMTLNKKPGIIYWACFPFLFIGAFQMVLTYLFGKGVIAVDMWLNLSTTNSSEANELLSQLWPAVIGVILIYIPSLVLAVWSVRMKEKLSGAFRKVHRHIAGGLLAASLLCILMAYMAGGYKLTDDMFPVNACYNCVQAMEREDATKAYKEASDGFVFNAHMAKTDTLPQVVVCVVGETSRAANWQLYGYERATNPILSKTDGLLVFRDHMSQSNTTHKSVPILLSLASAENYEILYRSKGIMAAYREAGYYTAYISNQQRNKSFIDFIGEQADSCVFLNDNKKGVSYDEVLIPALHEILKKGHRHLFVVLHTYGSHFNYYDRYPEEARTFVPDFIENAKKTHRHKMINAYDNSIRYTDAVLGKLIGLLTECKESAALLYTSDHGEDIFDDERDLFLHASPVPSYYQLHVPLVIWTSETYRQVHAQRLESMTSHTDLPTSSNCVFHTLLGLGGVETAYRNDSLSLVSPHFSVGKRYYINDRNEPELLRLCWDENDLKVLKKKNLRYE